MSSASLATDRSACWTRDRVLTHWDWIGGIASTTPSVARARQYLAFRSQLLALCRRRCRTNAAALHSLRTSLSIRPSFRPRFSPRDVTYAANNLSSLRRADERMPARFLGSLIGHVTRRQWSRDYRRRWFSTPMASFVSSDATTRSAQR